MSIILDIRKKLDNKVISAVELTKYYLNNIRKYNTSINAYISINEENAIEKAHMADIRIQNKKHNILTGIPITHKDNLCTIPMRTTCGSKMLDNYKSPFNATVVSKLDDKGMVLLGKSNMDEFGMGSTGENSFYGSTLNPWSFSHVSGGSSSGSAAAVASGCSPLATGSDTGGSVRQPSSFCGITGMKPTYGSLSRFGLVAYASSFDQIGVMAAHAYDLGILLNSMLGKDYKDTTSISLPESFFTKGLTEPCQSIKIGVDELLLNNLNKPYSRLVNACLERFENMGASIKKISLPSMREAISAYYILAPAEAASNLSRFDGVKFGFRSQQSSSLEELYINTRNEGFGDEVKRRIIIGNYVLVSSQYSTYYQKAQRVRMKLAKSMQKIYNEVDIVFLPASSGTAYKLNAFQNPVDSYLSDTYTLLANLTGNPAISFPIGFVNNMPFGGQLMTKSLNDAILIRSVYQYQKNTDFHLKFPKIEENLL